MHVNISLIIFFFLVSGGYVHGQSNWDTSPHKKRRNCRAALPSRQYPREHQLQIGEPGARWMLKLAQQLFAQGQARSAIEVLESLLAAQPWNFRAHTKIAQLYLLAREPELAERHAQNAIEVEGPTDRNLLNLIQIQQVDNPQKALETSIEASTKYPSNIFFLNKKGQLLRRLQQYAEAYQAIEQALALEPQNPVSLAEKAHILAYLGSYDEALKILDQLEKLNFNYEKIENIHALIERKLKTKSRDNRR